MGMFDAVGAAALPFVGSSAASIAGSIYQTEKAGQFAGDERDWATAMRSTAYQSTVQDLQKAGLNPMLAYGHGPNTAPTGASATPAGGNPATAGIEGATAIMGMKTATAQQGLLEAQADETRAKADETRARTPTHAVSIENMQQNIRESVAKIELMAATGAREYATAGQAEQQTQNLQAELPRIKATIMQLQTLANLQTAQAQVALKSLGKTDAEIQEIQQRVQAALPSLHRQLTELEMAGRRLDMPRREQESSVSEGFAGTLGALVRTLSPLSGLINAAK